MTNDNPEATASKDETEIRALIERWAKAVREENMAGIHADHDPGILMFDVPPPLLSRGLEAYMQSWDLFFSSQERPVTFDLRDLQITAGQDVAFATAIGRCIYVDPTGKREPLDFRLTIGLRKTNGQWRILHEHHSLPAE